MLGHLHFPRDLIKGGEVVYADITNLPFDAGSLDAAFSGACLLYFLDPESAETALTQLLQVLGPAGRDEYRDLSDIAANRTPIVCGAVRSAKPNTIGFMQAWPSFISTATKWLVSPRQLGFASS